MIYDNPATLILRLTYADGLYGTIEYAYDRVGNRGTRTISGETEYYTYFENTNLLDEITGLNPTTFAYDYNGNTTCKKMGSALDGLLP